MTYDTDTILTARLTLPALADQFGYSTSWFRDLRNRDRRFPPADGQGRYGLAEVVSLLTLRDIERMTEAEFRDYEADRRRQVLAAFEPGGGLASLGDEKRDIIAACPLRTQQEAAAEAEQDFEIFASPGGGAIVTGTRPETAEGRDR